MAIVGYSLLGLLALLLLLLCIPVSLTVVYRTGEPVQAYLRWLFLMFDLQNPPAKKNKKAAKKADTPDKPPAQTAKKPPMEFSQMLGAVADLLSAAKGAVGMLARNFKLYNIHLYLVIAEDDAAETAITYGKCNAAVYGVYAFAKNFLRMAHPDIQIKPDFTADEGSVDFSMRGRLTPIVAIGAGIRIGAAFLVKTFKRKKESEQSEVS